MKEFIAEWGAWVVGVCAFLAIWASVQQRLNQNCRYQFMDRGLTLEQAIEACK